MLTRTKLALVLFAISALLSHSGLSQEKKSNLPLSRQASFVESYSPTEWMIRAAGIGEGKKKRQEANALNDARKSAVYFCLYMGSDPILTTDEEKKRFNPREEEFFSIDNIRRYIAWEASEYSVRIRTSDGKQLKIEKTFRVNVGLLRDDLISQGVLMATADLTTELGMPQIVVIPEVAKDENPLEALEKQSELKQAARTIESYLTARRYDVVVPEQQDFLNNYGATMSLIQDTGEDLSHKIALSIGSDIYITFALNLQGSYVGSTENQKASASVRAFETTTGRLLGTETGYSRERPAAEQVVAEEAIHDAIDKVLARINAYWKEDLQRGIQYKIIFNLSGAFDRPRTEAIQKALASAIDSVALRSKEILATDKTVEYLIWARPARYAKARELYQDLRDQFALAAKGAVLERQQFNRKLLLLTITSK